MKFAVATLVATVGAKSFPGFSALHAHCELTTQFEAPCDQVYTALDTTMKGWPNQQGPAKGFYAPVEETGSVAWYTRRGAGGKYTDDVEFVTSASNGGCSVVSKSQSQSLSYYDYDTNYCNMYNPIRKSGLKFSAPKTSNCKFIPDDADTQCDKY